MNATASSVKRLAKKRTSKLIIAADCETDPAKFGRVPIPFIWYTYDGSEAHKFDGPNCTRDFVEYVSQFDCIVYAHNGGKFDWHYIIDQMEPFSQIMVISGRLAKFKIGKAEFRDSFNIMPMPLAAGGKKLEIDLSILERENRDIPANRRIIEDRCRTDCVYLFAMLDTFFTEFGSHLTISGASMDAWHRLSGIEKPRTDAEFYGIFEPYYFGGRVECFEPGIIERPFVIIDKNGAYQHAMLSDHPWGTIPHESLSLPNSRGGIERAFISLRCNSHGAFPFVDPTGHSLTFPADGVERDFNVTGWEFLAALETGTLHDYTISKVLTLPEKINFVPYMDHFYRMKLDARAANDDARYEFAKRFLCSFYGKFGSNPDNYSEYQIVEPRYIDAACGSDGYEFVCELGKWGLLSRPLLEERQHFYNVGTAASITGYVRADMWRGLRSVRSPMYCDTDAIHAADTGQLPIHQTEIGGWKLEATCDFGAYAGRKLYACRTVDGKWKKACKGVKLSADQVVRIASGEEITFEPEFPQYSIKNGIRFQRRKIRRTGVVMQ